MAMGLSESTSVSIQPPAITIPNEAESSHTSIVPQPVVTRTTRKIIWIFPVSILIALGSIALIGFFFAFVASMGAITMLTGNGILRAAHLARYTNNASAAYIGVVGSLITIFAFLALAPCVPKTHDKEGNETVPWYIQICSCMLFSTLSGTIGSAVLLHSHVDLGGIDVLHATRAGALGGAILGVGYIPLAPLIFAAVLLVLSPIWLAISMGARWVAARSSEDWKERNHWYSYCCCCGTRIGGDDPENGHAGLANGSTLR